MSKQYFLNRQIIIEPYNDNWPRMFAKEKANILSVLGNKKVLIKHVGSTAISGLAAKPIIDLMVGVKDLATIDSYIKPLATIGYEYVPELEENFPYRRYLHKGPNLPNKHFHLHMVEVDSNFWQKQLFFQDYLRSHPKALIEYQRLKENLAKQYQNDIYNYCEAKNGFIQEILAKGLCCRNSKKIKNKNISLWTETFGEEKHPAILLIAGAHAPSIFWPDFFCEKLVDAGYFVIRYDHRDIGYSTHFPTTNDINKPIYDLKDLTKDALAILDSYKIKKAIIIGHSMGGNIAQCLAAFHPKRILKAISISVPVGLSTHKHANYNNVMQKLLKNKPMGHFEKDWKRGWKRSLKLLNGSYYKFDETMAKKYVKTIYERHQGDFNPAWNHIAAQQNKPTLLNKLPSGMLFINGTDDIFSPCDDIKQLPGKFKMQILDGAGHIFFNHKLWKLITHVILDYLLE
jgi:GrpB-like predicted nucleotidyltransferase (UPF0157 family)/pimeloyl-ACP methyl ester carboxylesterase